MQINYKEKTVELISFLLLIEIFYFYNTYVTIGGFGVGYQYIGCILLVIVGTAWFLLRPDPLYFYDAVKTAGLLMLSYFVAIIYSMAIWIFSFTPIRQIISGFFGPAYMLLCILCAVSLAYILREKMVAYSFWALTAALMMQAVPKIWVNGIPEFFRRLIVYVNSGGLEGGGVSLEATSYSDTYVFFSLYFLFHAKEETVRKKSLYAAVIAFAMLIVFKRSALLALAVGFAAAFVYFRLKEGKRKWFLYLLMAVFMLFAFFYIPLIRYGLFDRIVEALHINTSYRNIIYEYYAKYFEFTPSYRGKGLGWVERLVLDEENFYAGLASVDVHCDYLRLYIELGFWGYLFWSFSVFPWLIKKAVKGAWANEDAVILGVSTAMASLRITENISGLYSAVLGSGIVILQCSLNSRDIKERDMTGG